jgi:hypothetical protein
MLDEPRTYHHSPLQFVFVPILVLLLILGLFNSFNSNDYFLYVPFALVFGTLVLFSLYSLSSTTTISEAGISSKRLWITKSLGWGEISRVSGSGYGIKLHNYDGDVTVSPSSQLRGYEEVIEIIGQKRPDLFASQEYQEMTRNWWSAIWVAVVALGLLGFAALNFSESSDGWLMGFISAITGLVIVGFVVSSPQTLMLQGDTLVLRYLFHEKTYRAREILSIQMGHQSSRNGRTYFVRLGLENGSSVRLSGMKVSVPILYLVLKEWQRRNPAGKLSV